MRNRRCDILAVLLAIAVASTATAQDKDTSELEAAREALIAARREHADASSAVSKAQVARMRLERSIAAEFQNRPELLQAKRYAGETSRHYDTLRNDVRKELAEDTRYQQLVECVRTAERGMHAQSAEAATLSDRLLRMHDLMAARAELTRYEAAAFALDPEIEDARLAMNAAHDAASRIERDYRKQAVNDPRLTFAVDEIEHAKNRLSTARGSLSLAADKLAAAEEREALRNASRRANPPPIRRQEP